MKPVSRSSKWGAVFRHVFRGNHGLHHIIKPDVIVPVGMGNAGNKIKWLIFGDGPRGPSGRKIVSLSGRWVSGDLRRAASWRGQPSGKL